MPWHELLTLLILGLAAGALGGMLGIGGSIIMIPVLTMLYRAQHPAQVQHFSQAIAMIVNVFVSLPALLQHHRAKAVRWDVVGRMLPFGVAFILVGVESSNQIDGRFLERLFGVFLLYVIAMNVIELLMRKAEPDAGRQRSGWAALGIVGSATGFTAGLLGVGGGIIAVPLLQRICRLPLRQCIATTAAFMIFSATIGAIRKNATLHAVLDAVSSDAAMSWHDSVRIAAVLAPTAVIGGLIGGRLTHALPLAWVRVAFILLMTWASAQMLGAI